MNLQSALARIRKLPPHILYPLILLLLVLLLVLAHAIPHRTAPAAPPARPPVHVTMPPAPGYNPCSPPASCPSVPRAAPASAHAAPAAPVPASAATVAARSVPVLPPAGVKPGYLREAAQGQDAFKAWLTLEDKVLKASTLAVTVPVVPAGAKGARRVTWAAWLHVTTPTQTVTLREAQGGAPVALTVAGQTVSLPASVFPAARSVQAVIALAPGWYQVALHATEQDPAQMPITPEPSRAEVELGSTNLNPVIPTPYWTPAAVPAAGASSAPTPAIGKAPAHSAAMEPAASKIRGANLGHSVPGSAGGAGSKGAPAGAKS